MIHQLVDIMSGAKRPALRAECRKDGRCIVTVDNRVLHVVLDADPERAGEPRLCDYAAECGGEAIGGRDEWDVAVRVVAAWAGERRGMWVTEEVER